MTLPRKPCHSRNTRLSRPPCRCGSHKPPASSPPTRPIRYRPDERCKLPPRSTMTFPESFSMSSIFRSHAIGPVRPAGIRSAKRPSGEENLTVGPSAANPAAAAQKSVRRVRSARCMGDPQSLPNFARRTQSPSRHHADPHSMTHSAAGPALAERPSHGSPMVMSSARVLPRSTSTCSLCTERICTGAKDGRAVPSLYIGGTRQPAASPFPILRRGRVADAA